VCVCVCACVHAGICGGEGGMEPGHTTARQQQLH